MSSSCYLWLLLVQAVNFYKYFRKRLEEWLRIMLEWEPNLRGQVQDAEGSKQVVGFTVIRDVLNKKVKVW